MEKINNGLREPKIRDVADKINEIIDWINKVEETEIKGAIFHLDYDKIEDRLKTLENRVRVLEIYASAQRKHNKILEDKVKFIMENAQPNTLKLTLQDLWDEQSNKIINEGMERIYGEPTDKSEKIEEIISEFNKRFWNIGSKIYYEATDTKEILVDTTFLESWLRDKLKGLM